jgi:hypothetical protein
MQQPAAKQTRGFEMTENTDRIRIRGTAGVALTAGALIVFFSCLVLSFTIMGTAFTRLFLVMLAAVSPFFLLGSVLFKAINWFEFDDDQQRIRRAFGRSFPYNRINTIRIKERWKRSSFSSGSGWLQKRWLVDGLTRDQTARVELELARRFPLAAIRRKAYSNGRMAMIISVFLLVISAVYSGFIYYSYTKEPRLFLMPEKKDWMSVVVQPRTGTHYALGGIGFVLPRRFKLLQHSESWSYFEDIKNGSKISASAGMYYEIFGEYQPAVRCLTGIADSYDLFRLAYVERFGTLPTAMKIISFSRTREIKLYEIERTSLRGFVLQGKKLGEAFAEIVVTDKAGGREIRLFIQQPGSLEEDILRSIVSSIKPEV